MTARHVAWARATFGAQPAEADTGGRQSRRAGPPQTTSVSPPHESANGQ